MRPLYLVWPYALVFWGVFIWVFGPESRIISKRPTDATAADVQDAGSKRFILIGQSLAMFAAFGIAAGASWAALPHRRVLFFGGLATLVAGSLLRRHCWRMLGESFSGEVVVRAGQAVVERGAYRYVRHPSYTAGGLIFIGIGIAMANWLSLAVLVGALAVVYGYRVAVEERALVATIGEPYRAYMARTKRFVPYLF